MFSFRRRRLISNAQPRPRRLNRQQQPQLLMTAFKIRRAVLSPPVMFPMARISSNSAHFPANWPSAQASRNTDECRMNGTQFVCFRGQQRQYQSRPAWLCSWRRHWQEVANHLCSTISSSIQPSEWTSSIFSSLGWFLAWPGRPSVLHNGTSPPMFGNFWP